MWLVLQTAVDSPYRHHDLTLKKTAVAKGLVVGDFRWRNQDESVSPADLDKKVNPLIGLGPQPHQS